MRAKYWSITRRQHGSSVNAAEPNGLRVSAYARSRLSAGIRPDRLYAATIVKCRWMSMRSHGGKGPLPTPRLQMRGPGPSDRHAVYRARCAHCGSLPVDNTHAGFQASKLFSPWQKDKPSDIAEKWLKAQGDENKLQAWWNTQAGLPYRANVGKALRVDELAARGEHWPARVPFGVGLLTAGLDTQPDRIEVEIVGWGRDEESWSIDYEIFEGNPDEPEVWQRVDAYLLRKWYRYDGRAFIVEAACIDSGGHNAQKVYEFAKARLGRRVYAVKANPLVTDSARRFGRQRSRARVPSSNSGP